MHFRQNGHSIHPLRSSLLFDLNTGLRYSFFDHRFLLNQNSAKAKHDLIVGGRWRSVGVEFGRFGRSSMVGMKSSTMAMSVMQVRKVRMAMREPGMTVAMAMWLSGRVVWCVSMLVMRVMDMSVLVLHRLMLVLMLVPFDEMQVEADAHEDRCCDKPKTDWLRKQYYGQRRTDEWRRREIGARSRASQVA
jgi:hypothetical protein